MYYMLTNRLMEQYIFCQQAYMQGSAIAMRIYENDMDRSLREKASQHITCTLQNKVMSFFLQYNV